MTSAPDQTPSAPLRQRFVSLFLAGGGVWGLVAVIWESSGVQTQHGVYVSVHVPVVFLLPFGLSVLGGLLLWTRARAGTWLAMLVLLCELVAFRSGEFEYSFTTGLGLCLVFLPHGELAFSVITGSQILAGRPPVAGDGYFALNGVAAACLVILVSLIPNKPHRESGATG